MKRFFYAAFIAAMAVSVTACSDNNDDDLDLDLDTTPQSTTISFESGLVDPNGDVVALSDIDVEGGWSAGTYAGIFWGKPFNSVESVYNEYTSLYYDTKLFDGLLFSNVDEDGTVVSFGSYYSDGANWGSIMDNWSGFVLSNNDTSEYPDGEDYTQQFMVASPNSVYSNNVFLAAYVGFGGDYSTPTIELSEAKVIESLYIANSPLMMSYTPYDSAYTKEYSVLISGYNGGSEAIATKTVNMFNAAGECLVEDWTLVDLSDWTVAVSQIVFTVVADDAYAPTYFCIDEITYQN